MSSDRFSSSSHWLPTTAAPAGSGGSTAGRSPQQQSLPPPPPPLMRSPGAALPSHPHSSTVPVPTSTLASTSLGADASLPHASPPPHTGGSASAAVKYVDASSMAAVRSASGSPSGFRVVNTSSAPFSFAAQSSNAYRPPRRQSYQQQQPQPQASRAPVYGAAPISSTGISGHTTDSTNTGSKSVNEVPSAHVVQVPIVVGASSSSSGGGEEHYSGGAAAHSHWRGGGSGGRSSHNDYTRRRSAGGHSDVMQGARRQPATQQRFQQQQQQSFGRQRGGGGHMYGQSLPLEALTEMSHPLAAEGGESHHAAPELPTTSAATSLTHSAGSGRTGRRGSGVSSGSGSGSVGGSALPHAAAAVDSPFTHQHPQQHQLVAAAASAAGGLPASSHGGGDGVAGTGTSPASSTVPQQHQLQQPISRSAVSASSATTTTTAAAATATMSGGSVGGARYTRPHGEERPTVALSLNVLSVYQTINEIFYQERQKLLAAPVKYAAARTYEDTAGHYIPCEGEVIADRYVFKELVGQGSFGKVLHCMDRKYNEPVAVKVIRSGPYFESQGWFEAQVVAHLNNDAALQNLVVQLRKVFLWKGHMVLVFEPLSFSLYKLITLTKHNGVSLDLTRKFAFQIVKVLLVLEQHQPPIIHCDLKPENVLLQDPSRSGVRVIDFGSACYQQQPTWRLPPAQVPLPASSPSPSAGPPWDNVEEGKHAGTAAVTTVATATSSNCNTACQEHTAVGGSDASFAAGHTQQQQQQQCTSSSTQPSSGDVEVVMPKYIQSRYYRSPEVILELGYTTAIDRWSLGCFLTEMHTGRPLFQGNHEADMIAYFTMVLGPLPDYMIAASPKRTRLYHTCPMESGGEGGGLASAASAATTSSVAQAQHQLQRQQRAASPLLAFTAPSSPVLTPSTAAPGHAAGSPFFLRAAQVEDTASATAHAVREGGGGGAPLERVLGVHTGGPRGCRAGQPGHDEAAYKTFYDFIQRLLQYDPRKRMSCAEAMQHPFLEPIRVLEARAAAAAAAATAAPQAHSDAVAAASPPPVVDGVAGGPTVTVALPPSSDAADV